MESMYPDSVFAIAADSSPQGLVWFLKIDETNELIKDSVDDYGNYVAGGFCVIKER